MINIQCPDSGQTIKVSPGSGSGSPGTICVYGDIGDEARGPAVRFVLTVRVRVVAGYDAPQPSLLYNPATDRDATVGGTTWCATGVPIPAGTSTGDGLTVFAWFPDSVGPGGTGVAQGQSFYAGGLGDKDCCADAPCASGSRMGTPALAAARIGGVSTAGRQRPLPATLYAGFSGGPADLNALTLTLRYIGLVDGYLTWRSNAFQVCSMSDAAALDLVCGRTTPGVWELAFANSCFQTSPNDPAPTGSSFPVFALTFSGIRLKPDCGKGNVTITVTP